MQCQMQEPSHQQLTYVAKEGLEEEHSLKVQVPGLSLSCLTLWPQKQVLQVLLHRLHWSHFLGHLQAWLPAGLVLEQSMVTESVLKHLQAQVTLFVGQLALMHWSQQRQVEGTALLVPELMHCQAQKQMVTHRLVWVPMSHLQVWQWATHRQVQAPVTHLLPPAQAMMTHSFALVSLAQVQMTQSSVLKQALLTHWWALAQALMTHL